MVKNGCERLGNEDAIDDIGNVKEIGWVEYVELAKDHVGNFNE